MKNEHNEFMQHELRLPELTVRGMLLGAVLTVIFTASNVYLGLKVGLTFSSAIGANAGLSGRHLVRDHLHHSGHAHDWLLARL